MPGHCGHASSSDHCTVGSPADGLSHSAHNMISFMSFRLARDVARPARRGNGCKSLGARTMQPFGVICCKHSGAPGSTDGAEACREGEKRSADARQRPSR